MLKRLLTVVLALMLVVGLAGIASANTCDVDMGFDTEIDVDLDITVGTYYILAPLDHDNMIAICQDGNRNMIGLVYQERGNNLAAICQDGDRNELHFVMQKNKASTGDYNVFILEQGSTCNRNKVYFVYQSATLGIGSNFATIQQNGNRNKVYGVVQIN